MKTLRRVTAYQRIHTAQRTNFRADGVREALIGGDLPATPRSAYCRRSAIDMCFQLISIGDLRGRNHGAVHDSIDAVYFVTGCSLDSRLSASNHSRSSCEMTRQICLLDGQGVL
jgi:hypothetical protein